MLGRRGETCFFFSKTRTIQGDRSDGIPDSRSGADNERSLPPSFRGKPLMRRKTAETYPLFSRRDFLSGRQSRRDRRFRAQSWPRCRGEKSGDLNRFTNDPQGSLEHPSQIRDQGLFWTIFSQREQYPLCPRQLIFGAASSYLLLPNMDRRYLPSYPRGKRRFATDEHKRSTYRSES